MKLLFEVDVQESNDGDSSWVDGCNVIPTTVISYFEREIARKEFDCLGELSQILALLLSKKVPEEYRDRCLLKTLRDCGFLSKEEIDKVSKTKLGKIFYTDKTGDISLAELENSNEYFIKQMVESEDKIYCEVDESTLPKSLRDRIQKHRDYLSQLEKKRKEREERRIRLKKSR